MVFSHIHRGWFILVITVLNGFACLGLARFSFGVILPFMIEGLSLSYSEAGLIASALFFGYLASAFFVGRFIQAYKEKKVIIFSLLLTAVGMFLSVISYHFWLAYIACFIMGLGSGAGNITSVGLVGKWFAVSHRGRALGITNSGSGLGMIFSGFIVPILMVWNIDGWRMSWLVLALCVLLILLINVFFLIDDPSTIRLKPVGKEIPPDKVKGNKASVIESIYCNKSILLIGLTYFAWGFSYLIFSTFFVDFLMIDAKLEMNLAGTFFAIAGIVSVVSGFIWGRLSDRIGRMLTLFFVYLTQTFILLLFAITSHPALLMIETIIYALTLWAVPTVIVAAVSDIVIPLKSPMAIGYITLFFGIGQWLSPMITGSLVEHFSYTIAFYLSAVVCGLGSIGCIYLHRTFRTRNKISFNPNIQEVNSDPLK
ncbi:MFS transporter [Niallia sp. Krafla_26]|uniref:MFS transporter n=1 Tax=Niallia sp. Krafla_26 TaxID=3064703 RepID=UPI003D176744